MVSARGISATHCKCHAVSQIHSLWCSLVYYSFIAILSLAWLVISMSCCRFIADWLFNQTGDYQLLDRPPGSQIFHSLSLSAPQFLHVCSMYLPIYSYILPSCISCWCPLDWIIGFCLIWSEIVIFLRTGRLLLAGSLPSHTCLIEDQTGRGLNRGIKMGGYFKCEHCVLLHM